MNTLDDLRRALADLPTIQFWFVVGAPWGDGDWVVAGHPDPHLGTRVCDTEDFDGECAHSLEYAAYIAAANPAVVNHLLQQADAAVAKVRAEQGRTQAAVEALQAARACIQLDRTSLADSHMNPHTNKLDADGADGVAEYDAVLKQIDDAIAMAASSHSHHLKDHHEQRLQAAPRL